MSNSQDKNWWNDPSALDNAWNDMRRVLDREMPEKKKTRAILWWWLSGAAALALMGWFFLLPKDNDSGELAVSKSQLAQPVTPEQKPSAADDMKALASPVRGEPTAELASPEEAHILSFKAAKSGSGHYEVRSANNTSAAVVVPETGSTFEDASMSEYLVTEPASKERTRVSREDLLVSDAVTVLAGLSIKNFIPVMDDFKTTVLPPVTTAIVVPEEHRRLFVPEFMLGVVASLKPSSGFGWTADAGVAWMISSHWSLAGGVGIAKWSFNPVITQYLQNVSGSGMNDTNRSTVSEVSELKPFYLVVPVGIRYQVAKNWQLGIGGSYEHLLSGQVNTALESLDKSDPTATPDFTANPGTISSTGNSTELNNQVWTGNAFLRYRYNRWIAEGYFHQGLSPFKKVNSEAINRQELGVRLGIRF
ncbi:MAG: hypothetical protein KDC28_11345 [Saprospiraceae bacterium]|nr:hypothetical protein [Saprospiraceae bacterium]MCB9319149.1 hypothetical protein [Lewinellaceae bacterium]